MVKAKTIERLTKRSNWLGKLLGEAMKASKNIKVVAANTTIKMMAAVKRLS